MKNSYHFALLAVAALLFATSNAEAAFLPTVKNIGLQNAGNNNPALVQETAIDKGAYNYVVNGALDKWTAISITYTATNVTEGKVISGFDTAYAPHHPSIFHTWPTIAVAGPVAGNTMSSTVVIKNLSDKVMNFSAYFASLVLCRCVNIAIGYVTSAVPLPSAAFLFLPGLLGIAGFSKWKKLGV